MSKLKLATTVAGLSGRYLIEQVTKPTPKRASEPPPSPERLTPEWLTDALCRQHPGAAVVGFELGTVAEGSTSRRPLRVNYNEAGRAAGLPTSIFTKSTPGLKVRLVSGLIGAQANEANYYTHLRPQTKLAGIEGPDGYHAVVDDKTQRSMLLIEDLSPRVRAYGDPTEVYVDRSMAES